MSALLAFLLVAQVDPVRLPIGAKGEQQVKPGEIVELRTGKVVTLPEVIRAARRKRFVLVGEQHQTVAHQQFEADVVAGLVADRRTVAVGLEMITRPKQAILDVWSSGGLAEDKFLETVEWKTQWGYDYVCYRPLFEQARINRLPMIGLNVPRDWVRSVGKGGFDALSVDQKSQLPPDLGTPNALHRQVFVAMIGGHPMEGARGENMYSAQVLWDEGMADTALKYMNQPTTSRNTVMVIAAGSGHVMYGQGINYRLALRTGAIPKGKDRVIGERGRTNDLNIVMIESNEPVSVSKGLADFVYVSPKPPTKEKTEKSL